MFAHFHQTVEFLGVFRVGIPSLLRVSHWATLLKWTTKLQRVQGNTVVDFYTGQHLTSYSDLHADTNTSTFELARCLQEQSSLLRIPEEILTMILRSLLTKDNSIRAEEELSGTPLRVPDLSSQVLRTCQLIHDKGMIILYNDNVLSIQICRSKRFFPMERDVSILGIRMPPSSLMSLSSQSSSRLKIPLRRLIEESYTKAINLKDPSFDMYQENMLTLAAHCYGIISRFRSVKITFHGSYKSGMLRETVKALQELLWQKKVTIYANDDKAVKIIREFRNVRCKSFEYVNVNSDCEAAWEDIDLITGRLPVYDIAGDFSDLRYNFQQFMVLVDGLKSAYRTLQEPV